MRPRLFRGTPRRHPTVFKKEHERWRHTPRAQQNAPPLDFAWARHTRAPPAQSGPNSSSATERQRLGSRSRQQPGARLRSQADAAKGPGLKLPRSGLSVRVMFEAPPARPREGRKMGAGVAAWADHARTISIEDVVARANLQLKRQGRELIGSCT